MPLLEAIPSTAILLLDVTLTITFLTQLSPFILYWQDWDFKKSIPQIFYEHVLYTEDTIFITYRRCYNISDVTRQLWSFHSWSLQVGDGTWGFRVLKQGTMGNMPYRGWSEKHPLRRWYLSSHLKKVTLGRTGLSVKDSYRYDAACTRNWNDNQGQWS